MCSVRCCIVSWRRHVGIGDLEGVTQIVSPTRSSPFRRACAHPADTASGPTLRRHRTHIGRPVSTRHTYSRVWLLLSWHESPGPTRRCVSSSCNSSLRGWGVSLSLFFGSPSLAPAVTLLWMPCRACAVVRPHPPPPNPKVHRVACMAGTLSDTMGVKSVSGRRCPEQPEADIARAPGPRRR